MSAGANMSGGGLRTDADALLHARRALAIALVQGNARLASTSLRLASRSPIPPLPHVRPRVLTITLARARNAADARHS